MPFSQPKKGAQRHQQKTAAEDYADRVKKIARQFQLAVFYNHDKCFQNQRNAYRSDKSRDRSANIQVDIFVVIRGFVFFVNPGAKFKHR